MSSICPSKSLLPSLYFAAQESRVNYISRLPMDLCALLGLASGDVQQEMGGRSKFMVFISLVPSLQVLFRPSVFLSQKSLHLKAANSM